MRFYTQDECEQWLSDRGRRKPDSVPNVHTHRIAFPTKSYGLRFFAHWMASSLTHGMPALIWVTEWSIWPSSENWHLYYKLRQSYADHRLLHEAPGHFFLEHEVEDMASFLQLAMLNGWGGYVLTHANSVNAFFSHDEVIDFYAETEADLAPVAPNLAPPPPVANT